MVNVTIYTIHGSYGSYYPYLSFSERFADEMIWQLCRDSHTVHGLTTWGRCASDSLDSVLGPCSWVNSSTRIRTVTISERPKVSAPIQVPEPMTDPCMYGIYIYMVCHWPSIYPSHVSIYIYIIRLDPSWVLLVSGHFGGEPYLLRPCLDRGHSRWRPADLRTSEHWKAPRKAARSTWSVSFFRRMDHRASGHGT